MSDQLDQRGGAVNAGSRVDIVCPQCGTAREFDAVRRAADEFCTKCDYPLFWAPKAAEVTVTEDSNEATLRRRPGTAGRQMLGSRSCHACGEPNPLSERHCLRCGHDFEPEAEAEAPPVERPWVPPPPVIHERHRFWWFPILLALLILAAAIAAAVYFLFFES